MTDEPLFSLLVSVYSKDRPAWVEKALVSAVTEQTRRPAQVVLVKDGPVGEELEALLHSLKSSLPVPVDVVAVPQNEGLAAALARGLRHCTHEIVARMDADDIALSDRFAKQLALLVDKDLDLVGGGMYEFEDDGGKIVGRRTPPQGQREIARYSRFHDPFNHPTVVYRREAVQRAGGYQPLGLMEDYWLFARMIHAGAAVDNLVEPVIMYRVGAGAYSRRGGLAQLVAEVRLQRSFRRIRFTTRAQFLRNIVVRATYRLVPVMVRRATYRALIANGFRRRRTGNPVS